MVSAALQYNAGYGHLPFDLFVLEHWQDITPALPADDQQQWNDLSKRYLNLSLVERWQFFTRILAADGEVKGATPLPTPTREQISRIFTPHQSIQERNISAVFCFGWNIVWLRTCYNPSLTEKYLELEQAAGARAEVGCLRSPDNVLDNASLYDLKGSDQEVLDQLLLRLPGLTDAKGVVDEYGDGSLILYGSGLNDPISIKQAEENEDVEKVRKLGLAIQNLIYVVDEEAVTKSIVKVWWIDENGKIIWDSIARMPYLDLDRVLGRIQDGQGFEDLVGEEAERGGIIV